jgi:hypothetical protein
VHPPLAEDDRDLAAEADRVIAAALVRGGKVGVVVDAGAVAQVVAEKRGVPFPVLASSPKPSRYLASARVVENTAPLSTVEAASKEAATVEAVSVETTARAD